jgi:sugar/nucleoside kinase (ribokinase family)
MGKRGVLSVAADSIEPIHVELDNRTGVAVETQEVVRSRPARLCGAGDAFAGGVLVRRAFGWSLLSDAGAFRPHVQDALAGCAAALRWIGVSSRLAADAFDVRPLPSAVSV